MKSIKINPFESIASTENKLINAIIKRAMAFCCEATLVRISYVVNLIITGQKELLKKECYNGLPDDLQVLRSLVWKINLRYLHFPITRWEKTFANKRREYEDIKNAFLLKLVAERQIYEDCESCDPKNKEEQGNLDLLVKNTDRILLETIDKDICRTHAHFDFFFRPINNIKKGNNEMKNEEGSSDNKGISKQFCSYEDYKVIYSPTTDKFTEQTHADILKRILYIYAKLNKDVGYVQGMNEILAPIYYCYSKDISLIDDVEINIEADTYWSFAILMDDIKPIFIMSKDKEKNGIFDHVNIFKQVIEKYDKQLYSQFKDNNEVLFYISFRWFSVFYSQSLFMSDTLRLWDTIFCERNRFHFVYYFALAILKTKKEKILKEDFYGIVKLLQKIDYDNIDDMIDIAIKIKKENEKKLKELIELK